MRKQEKEFMRHKCFTFFESYLEGADKIKAQLGTEIGYNYLVGIIRYALYEEESENPLINALVSSLKNTIDAGQDKREQGFTRENTDMTDKILEYKKYNPNATQREIAAATGTSIGKVNKALKKNKEEASNTNNTNNTNINNNSNSNTNSVNVNVNTYHDSPYELANAQTSASSKQKDQESGIKELGNQESEIRNRELENLDLEELESLKDNLCSGKKAGYTYSVLYDKYNLKKGSLNKNSINQITEIIKEKSNIQSQQVQSSVPKQHKELNIDCDALYERARKYDEQQNKKNEMHFYNPLDD